MKTVLTLLAFVLLPLRSFAAPGMTLGANFWNLGCHRPNDCFQDFRQVTGEDPWNPQFRREIATYRSLRFMDWNNTW